MIMFLMKKEESYMTKVKNVFFLVLVIIQKLINCIILLPRKLSLVVTLFFTKEKKHG